MTGLSEVYVDRDAAGNKTLSVHSYTINDGNNSGGNYTVQPVNATGVINKATLTITATTNTKTYDGNTSAVAIPTVLGVQTGDTVTGLSEVYADKNADSGKTLNVLGYTVNDGNSGRNYQVSTVPNTNGVIDKAPLTITAQTNDKLYDGTLLASALPTVSGLKGVTDNVSALTETYLDPNTGNGKTLTVAGYTVNDGNSGNNYTVTTVNDTTGTIRALLDAGNSSVMTAFTAPRSETGTTGQAAATTSGANANLTQTSLSGGAIRVASSLLTTTAPPAQAAPAPFALSLGGVGKGNIAVSEQNGVLTLNMQGAGQAAINAPAGNVTSALTIYAAGTNGVTTEGSFSLNAGGGSLSLAPMAPSLAVAPAVGPKGSAAGGVSFSMTMSNGTVMEYSIAQNGKTLSIQPLNDAARDGAGSMDKKLITATGMIAAWDKLGVGNNQVTSVVIYAK